MGDKRSALVASRMARTLNQTDLGSLVGLKQRQISRIEEGVITPPIDIQIRLASILGVSRHDIFPPTEASDSTRTETH
jgi:transcriptional regulator with XRE-family HTH domain